MVNANAEPIIELSRQSYSRNRANVEEEINATAQADIRLPQEITYDTMRQVPYVVDNTLYKEFSARGGQRWYFGQPEDVLTDEEKTTLKDNSSKTSSTQENKATDIIAEEKKETLPSSEVAKSEMIPPPAQPKKDIVEAKPQDRPKQETNRGVESKKNDKPEAKEETAPSVVAQPKPEPVQISNAATSEVHAPMAQENGAGETPQKEEISMPKMETSVPKEQPNRGHQHDDWLPIHEL